MTSDPPAGPGADPLIGRVLAGSYRLEKRLGRGAMGTVYSASHTLFKQSFAVKVLHPELAEDDDIRRRFLQEAQALALFSHKNAVAVRHCGEEQGLVFLAMDLCRGETLESVLAAQGALPEPRVVDLALQMLAALDEAHRSGIVHRDLKPANVMVEPKPGGGETARVLDFGLARILTAGREGATSRVSSLGEVVGTVAYMSPEQARGETLDGRSDLFSLGVLLFEMVEGRHPFLGGTMASVITRVLEADPLAATPHEVRRASEGLARVLGHALQKDPARRFKDAAAFAAALRDVMAGREIDRPHDARGEARARASRKRLALVGVGALLVVGLAWLGSLLLSGPGREAEATAAQTRATAERAMALGRWREAAGSLEALVAQGEATPEDRLRLVEARVALGDPDADRDLAALERLLPPGPRVHVLRGRFLHRVKRDPERALEAFATALVRDRGSTEAREARLDLLLDPMQAAWFASQRDRRTVRAAVDLEGLRAGGAPAGRIALAESRLLQARAESPALIFGAVECVGCGAPGGVGRARGHDRPLQVLTVLSVQGGRAHYAGQPQRSLSLYTEAMGAATEALRRLLEHPAHRAQGAREVEVLRLRVATAMQAGDAEVLAADARRLRTLEPEDPVALLGQAYALRHAGNFEEALPLYETLAEIAPDGHNLGDLAFCHQRIALGRLQSGERTVGVALLRRALLAYDRALTFVVNPVFKAYRGETRYLLALWVPEERAELLRAARQDLDEAHAESVDAQLLEVQFRRCFVMLAQGELEAAHAEISAAVLGKVALNRTFHGRRARCALALGCRALLQGDAFAAAPHRQQALDECVEAEARSGKDIGPARLLKGQARVLLDPLGTDPEAATDLATASDDSVMPYSDGVTEARAWAALAELRAKGTTEERRVVEVLLVTRQTEIAAGRDMPSQAFEEALADLLEQAGRGQLAGPLRELAARRPPP
jgi:serine/threonine-protein kinase